MKLTVGFIPLLDCASLVVAARKGFAAEEGLELTLVKESSWANIRDRVIVGHFDAAHMLGPMAVASTLGIGHIKAPMVAPFSLGLGGNAITVSTALWGQMQKAGAAAGGAPHLQGAALKKVVGSLERSNADPLTFAMVYPFSCHNYELRYWLAASGIHPDRDVRLVVIPPPFLVDAMESGQIDGFCVGEPWNSVAVDAGVGCIVTTTGEIWPLSPEKVLGCRAQWAEQNPQQLAALLRALHAASLWCQDTANHASIADLLASPAHVGTSTSVLERSLSGELKLTPNGESHAIRDFYVPAAHAASYPWVSHALWFYAQMVRWRQAEYSADSLTVARTVYRPDLYRAALAGSAVDMPRADTKVERFFDGRSFDPFDPRSYLAPQSA
ncbi:MAG TPA: CmpA/NrtA family ABC transporter substrate-binding protein [Steroidobacteraceae bacterium]|nr:CmpA/NrtA family ABC transporter substrate-binding protein [Steroidobacteraceae bacterium]